jgi:acyl carrier protein
VRIMSSYDLFLRELSVLKEVEVSKLQPGATLTDCGNWDSLVVVSFMAMADEKFGVMIPPAMLMKCRTVSDLAQLCGVSESP